MRLHKLIRLLAVASGILAAQSVSAAAPAPNINHPGPVISAYVQRGDMRLPIFLVDHLRKNDELFIATDKGKKTDPKWLLVLATVSPTGNKVIAEKFDLAQQEGEASITITDDDQVPVVVMAPQVRTMFGLRTSFSESADLIVDAIKADPQRFIDLQKIDQVNHAIALLKAMLDSSIQTQKPAQAVDAAKALAVKFGVRNVDPGCFKENTVNTQCVATAIVSSEDLTLPSDDIWAASGPNTSAAKVPTDIFASLKIVTEASTYLVNKYGDNYDFAPSSGQRQGGKDSIQLFTSARFKSGDIKTAYVYVPSWFAGKQPELSMGSKAPSCLSKGELTANIKGLLPLLNNWHDWRLVLREPGSPEPLMQLDGIEFKPDTGVFSFDFNKRARDLAAKGPVLEATLAGKFGFADADVAPFKVALSSEGHMLERIVGLDSLVAGEHARLRISGPDGACVEEMQVLVNDKTLATSSADARGELSIDLGKVDPGPATLTIAQYGMAKQEIPVVILKHKAHIQRLVHFDLENDVTAYGDNLDRIDSIQAGHVLCRPVAETGEPVTPAARTFTCSPEIASNANFPAQVTVRHLEQEPASFDLPVTKIGARPHMTVESAGNAIIATLSPKALQWNLNVDDPLVTDDSSIGILLHAFGGYHLSHGAYVLQLKFADDPLTDQKPISVPLLSDLPHNELRTRSPVSFVGVQLPSIVNPVWYRVQHQPSGLVGDWQALNRSVVLFPQLGALSCNVAGSGILIHGSQLELIDWASSDLKITASTPIKASSSALVRCDNGLCLGIDALGLNRKLRMKVHWLDDRLFDVSFPDAPSCPAAATAKY
jgi:hypothetical protein